MRGSVCPCGNTHWFGSDAPRSCERCRKCGMTGYPSKRMPDDHDWRPRYDEMTGKRLEDVCRRCQTRDATPGGRVMVELT